MKQNGWDVFRPADNGRGRVWLDRVFFDSGMGEDQVKRSLVDHDGFAPCIEVKRPFEGYLWG